MNAASGQRGTVRAVRERAYVEVASSELTRDINRDVILERLRALQPIARVDLARASGLQPSTVSSIVEQLLREGWIREGAVVKTDRGRRPTMLSLNDELLMLVADVRPLQAVLAVVDLNGRFLARSVVPLGSDVEQSVREIATGMERLRGQYPEKSFEGVGVSVPGRVDPETGRLLLAPNLHWAPYDVREALEQWLGLPTELENAANACLLAELWFGHLDSVRHAVLITISEGIGAAILSEGRLIGGHRGAAGEFGHTVVDPNGPECSCGQRGCWEMFASSRAALRYFAEQRPGTQDISSGSLLALAMDGDEAARIAVRRQIEAIGRGLRSVAAALAPQVVLFAGDIAPFWEMARPLLEAECARGLMPELAPRLVCLGDGEMARLRGAAAVVLQRHSGYYRASYGKRSRPVPERAALQVQS